MNLFRGREKIARIATDVHFNCRYLCCFNKRSQIAGSWGVVPEITIVVLVKRTCMHRVSLVVKWQRLPIHLMGRLWILFLLVFQGQRTDVANLFSKRQQPLFFAPNGAGILKAINIVMPRIFPNLNPVFSFDMPRFQQIMGKQMTGRRRRNRQNIIKFFAGFEFLRFPYEWRINAMGAIQRANQVFQLTLYVRCTMGRSCCRRRDFRRDSSSSFSQGEFFI